METFSQVLETLIRSHHHPGWGSSVCLIILHMGKLRHRQVKNFVQGHARAESRIQEPWFWILCSDNQKRFLSCVVYKGPVPPSLEEMFQSRHFLFFAIWVSWWRESFNHPDILATSLHWRLSRGSQINPEQTIGPFRPMCYPQQQPVPDALEDEKPPCSIAALGHHETPSLNLAVPIQEWIPAGSRQQHWEFQGGFFNSQWANA